VSFALRDYHDEAQTAPASVRTFALPTPRRRVEAPVTLIAVAPETLRRTRARYMRCLSIPDAACPPVWYSQRIVDETTAALLALAGKAVAA
jgi:hypothetical protein